MVSSYTLCWTEPHTQFLYSGLAGSGRHSHSSHQLREKHLHNKLIHPTDTAVYLKQRPPSGPLYVVINPASFATAVVSHSLDFFPEIHERRAIAHLL